MNKQLFESLIIEAQKLAERFSDPERTHNYNNDKFEIEEAFPLSNDIGAVICKKQNGLKALCIFISVNQNSLWFNFFPTDSHILGLTRVPDLKGQIEIKNGYKRHFPKAEQEEEEDKYV